MKTGHHISRGVAGRSGGCWEEGVGTGLREGIKKKKKEKENRKLQVIER